MSEHAGKTLEVTNARGDVTEVYPDFDPGDPVRVAPDLSGANLPEAETGWLFRGPTRHPRYAVIEDREFHTTVEVDRTRLSPGH